MLLHILNRVVLLYQLPTFEITSFVSQIKLHNPCFENDFQKWIVWWYAGIYKNAKNNSAPHVEVIFRELKDDGSLGERTLSKKVLIPLLGQLFLGSIWMNNRCNEAIKLDKKSFSVNLEPDNWIVRKVADYIELPVFKNYYPINVDGNSTLISFKLLNGGELLIPCQEYFSRCYGRSQEIKRIIATYSWDPYGYNGDSNPDSVQGRIFAKLREPEENNRWKVNLGKTLYNDDIVLAAHLKYDKYTQQKVKSIHTQLEVSFRKSIEKPAFIKIFPWHLGMQNLEVEGVPFDDGKSFLALRINGASDPQGDDISRQRQNTNLTRENNPLGPKGGWNTQPPKTERPIVNVTDEGRPDSNSEIVRLSDRRFRVLGIPRRIKDVHLDKAKTSGQKRNLPDPSGKSSQGDPSGNNKGIGNTSLGAPQIYESEGKLNDLWNTLNIMASDKHYGRYITKVQWYVYDQEFSSEEPIQLSSFSPAKEEDLDNYKHLKIDPSAAEDKNKLLLAERRKVLHWSYIEAEENGLKNARDKYFRGCLILKIIVRGRPIYLLEIERKVELVKGEQEQSKEKESFSGMVFTIQNDTELKKWAHLLLTELPIFKGVVAKVMVKCPGTADKYPHRSASWEVWPLEATVINAFKKIGISIPHRKLKVGIKGNDAKG
ncbi:hypothetical protein [Pseudoalteromonas sp. A2]|uniref:hypothetical protein n=1 Tax=Pseudoalteromonas sp. A2 TaxID=1523412 RepID=UPI00056AC9BF|nr:hypothetical protein [Pseudoalteromonas sp. A2]